MKPIQKFATHFQTLPLVAILRGLTPAGGARPSARR